MLRAVVAWLALWCVFLFLLARLRAARQEGSAPARQWLPRLLLGLAATLLATVALAAFVIIF